MSRYQSSVSVQSVKTDFNAVAPESDVEGILARGRLGDMETALGALAEAEKIISVQRRRIAYLEGLALNDEVTGLINRRGFMAALNRELAAAKRDPQAGGVLILFDLDDFKSINDTYGHAAGDAYLSAFAAVLASEVRPTDVVARIGGDEFAVLLTRAALKPGAARAQAIAKGINNRMMSWRTSSLPLKASSGIATYGARDIAEAIMVSADLKLYADKQKRKGGKIR